MKVLVLLAFCAATLSLMAGTEGEFRGTVVQAPENPDGWLFVEGHNHSIRRVYVSGAKIHYNSAVPAAERKNPVPQAIPAGTQVRITAEQDKAGEWRATDVEILGSGTPDLKKKKAPPPTSQT